MVMCEDSSLGYLCGLISMLSYRLELQLSSLLLALSSFALLCLDVQEDLNKPDFEEFLVLTRNTMKANVLISHL